MTAAAAVETESPEAGRLQAEARAAATARALPLLASYFADAPTWGLRRAEQLERTDPLLDDLAAFVRMRVALAAALGLEGVLRAIVLHASFHYSVRLEESVGDIRGQLDVPRYLRARGRAEAPRRYPIRILRRRYSTDENALAAYAAHWIRRELGMAPLHLIPREAPERLSALEARATFGRFLREPVLHDASQQAERVWRRRQLGPLVDRVKARLASGRVAARDSYEALVSWFEKFDPQRAGRMPGQVEWAFYDDRFDTKLFEIWSLALVTDSLSARLGKPDDGIRPLFERGDRAIASWNLGAIKLRIFFQASLGRIVSGEPKWKFVEGASGPLGGFPDIAVVIDRVGVAERLVVLADPKLRVRPSVPTEELYKLLGYYGNLPVDLRPRGGIVFYAPQASRMYRLQDAKGGELVALGVDPLDAPESERQMSVLTELIVGSTALPAETLRQMRATSAGEGEGREEAVTATRQAAAVEAMISAAASLPAATLDPTRKITEATLYRIWGRLSDATKTMLVTAEYFGQQAPRDADHSGPLLGLAATCERVLYDHLFQIVEERAPAIFPRGQTFGTLIRWLTDAFRRRQSEQGRAMHAFISGNEAIDGGALGSLIDDLWRLNNDFRIPAAHRDLVPAQLWVAGHEHILTGASAVLPRLVRALTREP
jgi:hypothetical protein